jgi:hypothetical protein
MLSRTQRDLISAPWRLIAEQPPTVQIGGSSRDYQAFVIRDGGRQAADPAVFYARLALT